MFSEDIAKRRGFFWISSEIYGGLTGFYEYAHLGTRVKRNWEDAWRNFFLSLDDNFYEIEGCSIMHENVFKASGHLESFVDPVVKCSKCNTSERADQLVESILKENYEGKSAEDLDKLLKEHNIKCPKCGGKLKDAGTLNMMFKVDVGMGKNTAYLRPETAQSVYINFKREFECLRKRLPLGLAIIGKAFRNEIAPRNSLLRMREFTQAELQIFFDPDKITEHKDFGSIKDYKLRIKKTGSEKTKEVKCSDMLQTMPKFYVYHMAKVQQFYLDVLKIKKEKFRFRELSEEEKAFYNKYHWDVELELNAGWKEMGGVHYRTDHDLLGHKKQSNQDMAVNIDGKKFIPHVLELSFGVDRNIYAALELFYEEEKERTLFRLPAVIAPYGTAVFPLVNKDKLPEKAREVKKTLESMGFKIFYDESGSIGRRYRRVDEIGVPLAVTCDHQTLQDNTVTIRTRDDMQQVRVGIKDLCQKLYEMLG